MALPAARFPGSSGRWLRRVGGSLFIFPRQDENQPHADADGAVRHVERRKTDFMVAATLHMKIEKIRHVPHEHAVDEVPDDAAENQPQRHLPERGVRIKVMPAAEQY